MKTGPSKALVVVNNYKKFGDINIGYYDCKLLNDARGTKVVRPLASKQKGRSGYPVVYEGLVYLSNDTWRAVHGKGHHNRQTTVNQLIRGRHADDLPHATEEEILSALKSRGIIGVADQYDNLGQVSVLPEMPSVNRSPKRLQIISVPEENFEETQYERDPAVRASVLMRARGTCELCHNLGEFIDPHTGFFRLHVHHVIYISQGGYDWMTNAVAIHPTCHDNLHHAPNRESLREQLYCQVSCLDRNASSK